MVHSQRKIEAPIKTNGKKRRRKKSYHTHQTESGIMKENFRILERDIRVTSSTTKKGAMRNA